MGLFDSISEAVSNMAGGLGDQASNITDQVSGAAEDITSQIPGADQVQDIIPGGESGSEEQE